MMRLLSKPFTFGLLLFISFAARSQKTEPDSLISCTYNVEVDAGFPGGNESWDKYVRIKLNTRIAKQNGAPAGVYTINVRFLITKEGSIDSVKALTNHGYGMEQEAVRVVQQSPKWSPAIKNARQVTQWKECAITYTVSGK